MLDKGVDIRFVSVNVFKEMERREKPVPAICTGKAGNLESEKKGATIPDKNSRDISKKVDVFSFG